MIYIASLHDFYRFIWLESFTFVMLIRRYFIY